MCQLQATQQELAVTKTTAETSEAQLKDQLEATQQELAVTKTTAETSEAQLKDQLEATQRELAETKTTAETSEAQLKGQLQATQQELAVTKTTAETSEAQLKDQLEATQRELAVTKTTAETSEAQLKGQLQATQQELPVTKTTAETSEAQLKDQLEATQRELAETKTTESEAQLKGQLEATQRELAEAKIIAETSEAQLKDQLEATQRELAETKTTAAATEAQLKTTQQMFAETIDATCHLQDEMEQLREQHRAATAANHQRIQELTFQLSSSNKLPHAEEHLRTVSNALSQSQKEICSLVRSLRPGIQDLPKADNPGDDADAQIRQLCNDRNEGATALIAAVRTLDEIRTELVSALNSSFCFSEKTSIGDFEHLFSQELAKAQDEYDDLLKQHREKEDAKDEQLVRLNALNRRLERQERLSTAESVELHRLEADNLAIDSELIQLQANLDKAHLHVVETARELQKSFPEMLLRIPVEDDVVPTGEPAGSDVMYRNDFVTVYKAKVNGETRCIKRQDIPTDEKGRMRLRREVDVLRELRGPGVLPLLYSKEYNNYHYIVTPYYELGSLADFLELEGPEFDSFVVNKCVELLSGLHRIHSSEVVHGDLKPRNIFVSAAKEFVIGDFGAAKTTDATTTDARTTDVLSMGLVLEELAVRFFGESVRVTGGERPFAGFTDAPPLPLQGHADMKLEWLKHMLGVMLQSEPTRRWTVVDLLTHQFLAPGEDGERARTFTADVRAVVQGDAKWRIAVDRRPQQQEDTNSLLSQCYGIPVDTPLGVAFAGESGLGTGLTKELYSHLLRDVVRSRLLVTGCDGGAVMHVGCDIDVEAVADGFQSLELLGVQLMRFALAYGSPIGGDGSQMFPAFQCPNVLSRYLMRFLLALPVTEGTPSLCPTASEFAEFDHDSAARYAEVQKHPARARQYDLTLNDGSMVTALTVSRLVEERRRDSMHDSRQRSLQAVRAGFQRNHELLLAVREWVGGAEQQLQIKLCLGNITSEDVVRALSFDSSLQANSPIATLLKEYLRSCGKFSLLRFLYFVTGGYALVPIRVFLRQHDPSAAWPLPSVATCFNHLKLYSYPDLETLTERLHYAMEVSVTIEG